MYLLHDFKQLTGHSRSFEVSHFASHLSDRSSGLSAWNRLPALAFPSYRTSSNGGQIVCAGSFAPARITSVRGNGDDYDDICRPVLEY